MADDTMTITEGAEASAPEGATPPSLAAESAPQRDDERMIYEVGYQLVPAVALEDAAKEAVVIRALVEKEGGVFISEELPKPMPLAYEIARTLHGTKEKYSNSYFGWIKFEIPREAAKAAKASLSAHGPIIRFCFVKTVREDTRIPKHVVLEEKKERQPRTPLEPLAIERRTPVKEETKARTTLTDEEIDKTIEELMAE